MNNKTIKNKIISQIKNGDIQMRPKIHFTLLTILVVVGVVLVVAALIYFASFTAFVFRINGLMNIPSFGFVGVIPFLQSIPWILLALVIVFLIILEVLTRYFSFSHKVPLIYTILAILVITVLGSSLALGSSFHDKALIKAEDGKLPFAGMMYNRYNRNSTDSIFNAEIIEVRDSSITAHLDTGDMVEVLLTDKTHIPPNVIFKTGMEIMILGSMEDSVISAIGLRPVSLYKNKMIQSSGSGAHNKILNEKSQRANVIDGIRTGN